MSILSRQNPFLKRTEPTGLEWQLESAKLAESCLIITVSDDIASRRNCKISHVPTAQIMEFV